MEQTETMEQAETMEQTETMEQAETMERAETMEKTSRSWDSTTWVVEFPEALPIAGATGV